MNVGLVFLLALDHGRRVAAVVPRRHVVREHSELQALGVTADHDAAGGGGEQRAALLSVGRADLRHLGHVRVRVRHAAGDRAVGVDPPVDAAVLLQLEPRLVAVPNLAGVLGDQEVLRQELRLGVRESAQHRLVDLGGSVRRELDRLPPVLVLEAVCDVVAGAGVEHLDLGAGDRDPSDVAQLLVRALRDEVRELDLPRREGRTHGAVEISLASYQLRVQLLSRLDIEREPVALLLRDDLSDPHLKFEALGRVALGLDLLDPLEGDLTVLGAVVVHLLEERNGRPGEAVVLRVEVALVHPEAVAPGGQAVLADVALLLELRRQLAAAEEAEVHVHHVRPYDAGGDQGVEHRAIVAEAVELLQDRKVVGNDVLPGDAGGRRQALDSLRQGAGRLDQGPVRVGLVVGEPEALPGRPVDHVEAVDLRDLGQEAVGLQIEDQSVSHNHYHLAETEGCAERTQQASPPGPRACTRSPPCSARSA